MLDSCGFCLFQSQSYQFKKYQLRPTLSRQFGRQCRRRNKSVKLLAGILNHFRFQWHLNFVDHFRVCMANNLYCCCFRDFCFRKHAVMLVPELVCADISRPNGAFRNFRDTVAYVFFCRFAWMRHTVFAPKRYPHSGVLWPGKRLFAAVNDICFRQFASQ